MDLLGINDEEAAALIAAAQNAAAVNTAAPASLPESHALPGNILRGAGSSTPTTPRGRSYSVEELLALRSLPQCQSLPESHALPGNILRGAHAKAKAGGKGKAKPAGPAPSVPQPTVAPS